MNRGSERGHLTMKLRIPRFNEAPIHESGKYQEQSNARWTMRASMRPRFMNRGSPSLADCTAPKPPRFNEAPIHESGK